MFHVKRLFTDKNYKEPYIIRVSGIRKKYVYDYDLANLFYKALQKFSTNEVHVYCGFYLVQSIIEVVHEQNFSIEGARVDFIPANQYILAAAAGGLKTGVTYDFKSNPCNLSRDALKVLREENRAV